jgi:hypothetical protein
MSMASPFWGMKEIPHVGDSSELAQVLEVEVTGSNLDVWSKETTLTCGYGSPRARANSIGGARWSQEVSVESWRWGIGESW